MLSFEESVIVRRKREDVFNFIADGEKASMWNSAVKEVKKVSGGPTGLGTRYHMVRDLPWGRVENEYEIVEYVPFEAIAIKSTQGPTPFTYRYVLDSIDQSTRITLNGEGDTSDITHIPGFIMKVGLKRGAKENLESLKGILENQPR
jgi:hypothetical protein